MNALQNGEVILSLLVSFHVDKEGREFQDVEPPSAPAPEEIPEPELGGHNTMFDLRPIYEGPGTRRFPGISHRFWARTRGPLPDDRLTHECVLTYLSDMGTGFIKVPTDEPMGGPSLDHAVWFHRPVRMDEWVLVDLDPVVASGKRAYYTGAVFSPDGKLVASLAQEHLMVPRTFGRRGGLDHAVGTQRRNLVVGEAELTDEHIVVVFAETRRRPHGGRNPVDVDRRRGSAERTDSGSVALDPPVRRAQVRVVGEVTSGVHRRHRDPAPLRFLEERLLRVPGRQAFDPHVDEL